MAGICAGPGLESAGGLLQLAGARSQAFPAGCSLGALNGLRVDPDTGDAWVPPDAIFSAAQGAQTGADRTIAPASSAAVLLSKLDLTMTAPACRRSLFLGDLAGGYQGFRAGTGNFWLLSRFVTIYVDGAPIGFTGLQPVGGLENNSGGAISIGGPVEAQPIRVQLTAGQKIRVYAEYSFDPATFTASAVNALTWRAPKLNGVLLSYPQ